MFLADFTRIPRVFDAFAKKLMNRDKIVMILLFPLTFYSKLCHYNWWKCFIVTYVKMNCPITYTIQFVFSFVFEILHLLPYLWLICNLDHIHHAGRLNSSGLRYYEDWFVCLSIHQTIWWFVIIFIQILIWFICLCFVEIVIIKLNSTSLVRHVQNVCLNLIWILFT